MIYELTVIERKTTTVVIRLNDYDLPDNEAERLLKISNIFNDMKNKPSQYIQEAESDEIGSHVDNISVSITPRTD